MTFDRYPDLLEDISLMLYAEDYNVIIKVGETQNTKEFHAHSNILKVRSQYFKNAFLNESITTKKNDIIMFNKPNITPTVFDMILK